MAKRRKVQGFGKSRATSVQTQFPVDYAPYINPLLAAGYTIEAIATLIGGNGKVIDPPKNNYPTALSLVGDFQVFNTIQRFPDESPLLQNTNFFPDESPLLQNTKFKEVIINLFGSNPTPAQFALLADTLNRASEKDDIALYPTAFTWQDLWALHTGASVQEDWPALPPTQRLYLVPHLNEVVRYLDGHDLLKDAIKETREAYQENPEYAKDVLALLLQTLPYGQRLTVNESPPQDYTRATIAEVPLTERSLNIDIGAAVPRIAETSPEPQEPLEAAALRQNLAHHAEQKCHVRIPGDEQQEFILKAIEKLLSNTELSQGEQQSLRAIAVGNTPEDSLSEGTLTALLNAAQHPEDLQEAAQKVRAARIPELIEFNPNYVVHGDKVTISQLTHRPIHSDLYSVIQTAQSRLLNANQDDFAAYFWSRLGYHNPPANDEHSIGIPECHRLMQFLQEHNLSWNLNITEAHKPLFTWGDIDALCKDQSEHSAAIKYLLTMKIPSLSLSPQMTLQTLKRSSVYLPDGYDGYTPSTFSQSCQPDSKIILKKQDPLAMMIYMTILAQQDNVPSS